MKKSEAKDTFELLEELAKSEVAEDSSKVKKFVGVYGVDKTGILKAEIDKLHMDIKAMKEGH